MDGPLPIKAIFPKCLILRKLVVHDAVLVNLNEMKNEFFIFTQNLEIFKKKMMVMSCLGFSM